MNRPTLIDPASGQPVATAELIAEVDASLRQLQDLQARHDSRFHRDVMGWEFDKQVEHCQMHLSKLAGLLATVCEKKHHGESNEEIAFVEKRIADLLVFALKLANLYNLDLEETYKSRLYEVERKKLA